MYDEDPTRTQSYLRDEDARRSAPAWDTSDTLVEAFTEVSAEIFVELFVRILAAAVDSDC